MIRSTLKSSFVCRNQRPWCTLYHLQHQETHVRATLQVCTHEPGAFKSEVGHLPIIFVYIIETPEDKLDSLLLPCLERHYSLVRQKFTRPHAPYGWKNTLTLKLRRRDHFTTDCPCNRLKQHNNWRQIRRTCFWSSRNVAVKWWNY